MSRYFKPANTALVISILALIAAVVVPAVAQVATTSLSKNEKRLIRKIARLQANKLITKRAPGLSVKQAQTAKSANSALSAVNSQNATNADKVDGLDAGCPSGTVLAAGACFETAKRPPATSVNAAIADCADEGRYIGTPAELGALNAVVDIGLVEYTSSVFVDEGFKVMLIAGTSGSIGLSWVGTDVDMPYRCVTGPVG